MRHLGFASRIAAAASALALVASAFGAGTATAQERPADLESLPPVPTDFQPPRTAGGDPDIRTSYQIECGHARSGEPKRNANRSSSANAAMAHAHFQSDTGLGFAPSSIGFVKVATSRPDHE